jgi:hypothetical protein
MKMKIIGVFGLIAIMLLATITIPVVAENEGNEILAVNKILAIGMFTHCEMDEVINGYILIGFIGSTFAFNTYIMINDTDIQNIVMTDFFLYCVYSS